MYPTLFEIGGVSFHSFGLMAALALIVPGLLIVRPLIRRRGVNPEFAVELIVAAGIGGFVGARLYYLAEHWSFVREDLGEALFGSIGFTWYGGLIGGFLAVVAWTLIRRVPLGVVANAMAPAIAAGYAIGRVGCQLSGDGDYGRESDLPWAMGYPNGTVPTPPGVTVHPTPVYEILIMLPIIWVLWRLAGKDHSGWWTFGWFLVLSGAERLLIEFLRRNPEWFAGLTQPQWVAVGSIAIGAVLVLAFARRPAETARPAKRGTSRARRR